MGNTVLTYCHSALSVKWYVHRHVGLFYPPLQRKYDSSIDHEGKETMHQLIVETSGADIRPQTLYLLPNLSELPKSKVHG